MARAARDRGAGGSTGRGAPGAGRRNRRRPATPDGSRPDGRAVQSHRGALAAVAGPGGVRMTVTYRDASPDDAAALKALFAESFVATFGHIYRPADLDAFLAANSDAKWRTNLSDPEVAIRVAETDGELAGFVELAPKQLPHETSAPALELRRLYLRRESHGTGVADALMTWALDEAARRGAQ